GCGREGRRGAGGGGGGFGGGGGELGEIRAPPAELDDLANVIHWLQAEPRADAGRLGIWGTSFGGGMAVYAAGRDRRVKAVHAQMVPLDIRALDSSGYRDGTKRARGELGYPEPGSVAVGGRRGARMA